MKQRYFNLVILALIVINFILFAFFVFSRNQIGIFHPRGIIASGEQNVITSSLSIMLIAVVPALVLAVLVLIKKSKKRPERKSDQQDHKPYFELAIWMLPVLVILILATMTWKSAHKLDPYQALASNQTPINIKVVALRWKWLFIYPAQNIATVNYLEIPANTPINLDLTADGLMNSFWIPQLSGQIYAMAGMQTHLNIMADQNGEYQGSAAEINGSGFADMKFTTKAVSASDFASWSSSISKSQNAELSLGEYDKLSQPSEKNPIAFYTSPDQNLFGSIISRFTQNSNHVH